MGNRLTGMLTFSGWPVQQYPCSSHGDLWSSPKDWLPCHGGLPHCPTDGTNECKGLLTMLFISDVACHYTCCLPAVVVLRGDELNFARNLSSSPWTCFNLLRFASLCLLLNMRRFTFWKEGGNVWQLIRLPMRELDMTHVIQISQVHPLEDDSFN